MQDGNAVGCKVCGELTLAFGTRMCNNCWELGRQIAFNPDAARKILTGYDDDQEVKRIKKDTARRKSRRT